LNDQWVIKEIRGEIKVSKSNEIENIAYHNLWDTAKAVEGKEESL
jgi:hypothetical protein